MWGLFWNIQLIQRREQLSQCWLSCSWVWDSCSRAWDSCSGGKIVGLFQKWYDFSESGTTFWCKQLSRGCISSSAQWQQQKNVRAWVYRAWVFSKNRFHFHTPLSTGLSRPFSRFWRFTNVSHLFCESDVKRLEPFAPARNAREPLYTGVFCINCESERYFLKKKKAPTKSL